MAATSKRLDLRFGAFACSVQGFDDPVQPVQQILRAIQHLLEESPDLADAGINFDAEAIEQLIGEVARRADLDEGEIEIVPGLVIIHHGAGGDLAATPAEAPAEGSAEAAWSAGEEKEDGGGEGYVNIFAPAGDGPAEETGSAEDGEPEEFADRLRRMAQGSDDDYGWSDDEEGGGAPVWPYEPEGAAEKSPAKVPEEVPPENGAEEDSEHNVFAPEETPENEPGVVHNLFAAPGEEAEDDWELSPAAGDETEAEAEAPAEEEYTAARLAERAGARTVPELMVASAAWMVLMKGQTSFKRRDVLDVFETLPGEHEKTLEAQIKGFGKAVRNGQLVSVEDGIFGLARAELERYQRLL